MNPLDTSNEMTRSMPLREPFSRYGYDIWTTDLICHFMGKYCTPAGALCQWALVSKKYYQVSKDERLWRIFYESLPACRTWHIIDCPDVNYLEIYKFLQTTLLKNIEKIYHPTDVNSTIIPLPNTGRFLGKVWKFFFFLSPEEGRIVGYYPAQSGAQWDEDIQILTRNTSSVKITHVFNAHDDLFICYSDGAIEIWNIEQITKKFLFQITLAECTEGTRVMCQLIGTTIFLLTNRCLYIFDENGNEKRIFFLRYNNDQLKVITLHPSEFNNVNINVHCLEKITAIRKMNKQMLLGTSRGGIFVWDPYTCTAQSTQINVESAVLRIDSDSDDKPNYIVVSSFESVWCINIHKKKHITVYGISGSDVLSVTFQKNFFFLALRSKIHKCNVDSPLTIPIYQFQKKEQRITSCPQAWDGPNLFFSPYVHELTVIDFSIQKPASKKGIRSVEGDKINN